MYVIREMQTAADGTVAHLPPVDEADRFQADSVFYQKAASAAISAVPVHTVLLETDEGVQLIRKTFKHGAAIPLPSYVIFEVQANHDGSTAHLPPVNKTDRLAAESAYYNLLSYAAISDVSRHSVILETNEGQLIMRQCYKHGRLTIETEDHSDEPIIDEEEEEA